jgi:hypothetical protein
MADDTIVDPLRQRMIDDMMIRGMAAVTQRNYLRCVRNCCAFAHKPPQALTFEDARRFLLHVVPDGFHRIRYYGLFANNGRAEHVARARTLLGAAPPAPDTELATPAELPAPKECPCCGGRVQLIEVYEPSASFEPRRFICRIDTS